MVISYRDIFNGIPRTEIYGHDRRCGAIDCLTRAEESQRRRDLRDRRSDAEKIADLERQVQRLTNDNAILARELIAMRKAGR